MAGPLHVERVGGRYHATACGNERRNCFRGDTVGSTPCVVLLRLADQCSPLAWVRTEPLSKLCGGRNDAARRAAIRLGVVVWPKAGKAVAGQTGGVCRGDGVLCGKRGGAPDQRVLRGGDRTAPEMRENRKVNVQCGDVTPMASRSGDLNF